MALYFLGPPPLSNAYNEHCSSSVQLSIMTLIQVVGKLLKCTHATTHQTCHISHTQTPHTNMTLTHTTHTTPYHTTPRVTAQLCDNTTTSHRPHKQVSRCQYGIRTSNRIELPIGSILLLFSLRYVFSVM